MEFLIVKQLLPYPGSFTGDWTPANTASTLGAKLVLQSSGYRVHTLNSLLWLLTACHISRSSSHPVTLQLLPVCPAAVCYLRVLQLYMCVSCSCAVFLQSSSSLPASSLLKIPCLSFRRELAILQKNNIFCYDRECSSLVQIIASLVLSISV